MKFQELPSQIRIKLDPKGDQKLWKKIEEKEGGITKFAEEKDQFSRRKIYNWKNKEIHYPKNFVSSILEEPEKHVISLKGRSRSKPLKNPVFPIKPTDELLTRIKTSVSVNKEGVPLYRSTERSLIERFQNLLSRIGEVPTETYIRDTGLELRYPKYLHEIFQKIDYEEDFAALVDETGFINDDKVVADGEEVDIAEFDEVLYSRDKRMELALRQNDSAKIKEIILEEASKVEEAFN